MGRKQIAIRNSAVGLMSQMLTILLQFITRSVFIRYLSIELLAVSSTFTSLLKTLSLAELGFQTAVTYVLYKPLSENDHEKVNEIVNVLRVIYMMIGFMFCIAGVVLQPLLKVILSDVEVTPYIRVIFLIQVANSACSYFLAYRRTLLHADQMAYLLNLINTFVNVLFTIGKIFIIILTKNYLLYISATTVQTIASNLIIHVIDRKRHPYIHRTKFNKDIFRQILGSVKHLFAAKIAGYIYSSTDYLVISSLVSTVAVGFMTNYTTITTSLRTLVKSVFTPLVPTFGRMLTESKGTPYSEKVFRRYTFIRFITAGAVIIPTFVLIQDFISNLWLDERFLLSTTIVILYCIDMYIDIVHSALCDFINAMGLFKEERNIEIIGAASNIILSLALAKPLGIAGVLIGTAISQSVFWILRSRTVFVNCFKGLKGSFSRYWLDNFGYIVLFLAVAASASFIYNRLPIRSALLRLLAGGVECEVMFAVAVLAVFGRTDRCKELFRLVKAAFRKFSK